MLDLFDEIDGRLARAMIHCPDLYLKILSIKKHVIYALNHPEQADLRQIAKDTLGKITALMVMHHELLDDLHPVVDKLKNELA